MAATWVSNKGAGMSLGQIPDDFQVLPGGMEDLDDVGVGHQLEKRREVQPFRDGVDGGGVIVAGDLDDADFWPKGRFAEKFRIDGDEGVFGKGLANGGQSAGIRDEAHEIFLIQARRGARASSDEIDRRLIFW